MLNVKGVYGDACDLPFENETFDVVMSYEFFEHVTDVNLAMKEQIRVLRSDGILVIAQANFLNDKIWGNSGCKGIIDKEIIYG